MGYFSNGTEGHDYQERYCNRCIHDNYDKGIYCPIWNLHLRDNYSLCNEPSSYLNDLIPRTKDDLGNERCRMFVDRNALSTLQIEKIEHDMLTA